MKSNKFAKDQMGIFFYANPESCWPARKYNKYYSSNKYESVSLCILPFLKCFKTKYINL